MIGPARVVPGTTTVGAEQSGPGVVTMSLATAARTSVTHLGPPRTGQPLPDEVKEIAATLTAAGLPTEALDSADVVIWTKLALAGPMGPVTALLRRTVRDVTADEHSYALVRAMFEEIVAVAHATGVPLDAEAAWAHALTTFREVGPHTTSMAADVLARRRTEIDAFCGEVTRLGAENGVPTPVNWVVGQCTEGDRGDLRGCALARLSARAAPTARRRPPGARWRSARCAPPSRRQGRGSAQTRDRAPRFIPAASSRALSASMSSDQ